jgi:hypothetical protein
VLWWGSVIEKRNLLFIHQRFVEEESREGRSLYLMGGVISGLGLLCEGARAGENEVSWALLRTSIVGGATLCFINVIRHAQPPLLLSPSSPSLPPPPCVLCSLRLANSAPSETLLLLGSLLNARDG